LRTKPGDSILEPASHLAELDVAEEAKARIGRDAVEDLDDLLDLQMIGGHAVAHQSERHRQPIEHVHVNGKLFLFEQVLGSIKGRWA
jgi:hypothetical protein